MVLNLFRLTIQLSKMGIFLIPIFFFSTSLLAQNKITKDDSKFEDIKNFIETKKIYEDLHWLRLIHFVDGEGEIDSPQFYLSPNGKKDPKAELLSFAEALLSEDTNLEEQKSVQCRFPARTYFLRKVLSEKSDNQIKLPARPCPQFQRWFETLRGNTVSLVFSSYYLNNPSSTFGHTFLRINKAPSAKDGKRYELLDYGVNYAANPTTENPLLYTFMGLFGGFPGTFTTVPYYYKVREYNNAESRDLWEYEINLSQEATDILVAHVWELGPTYADYWYLTENCSYFVLTLIEAADPKIEITKNLKKFVIPTDTVQVVWNIPGLVKGFTYRPSIRSEFFERYKKLSKSEQTYVAKTISELELSKLDDNLNPKNVYDAIIDGLDYKYPVQVQKKDSVESQFKNKILSLRSQINEITPPLTIQPSEREYPHLGHGSRRVGLGWANSSTKNTIEKQDSYLLSYKFAHHELMDPDQGYPEYAQINFFDFRGLYSNSKQKIRLERLTLFEVISLTTYSAVTQSPSWRLQVGFSQSNTADCFDCVAAMASGGAGYGFGFLKNEALIFYLGLNARLSYQQKPVIGFGPQTTVKLKWNQNWISLLEGWYRKDLGVDYNEWKEIKLATQYNFKFDKNDMGIKFLGTGWGFHEKYSMELFYYY